MPTLEELLNLRNQSLSSFAPKKDTEEAIVADALASSTPFFPTPTGAPISEEQLKEAPIKMSSAAPIRAPIPAPSEKVPEEESQLASLMSAGQKQESQYEDLLKRYKEAQDRQKQMQLTAALGQAAEKIGSSIAMVKPGDQSFYEQQMKLAGGITDQFKEEEAVRREAEKNDPKSETSVAMRNLLKEQGVKVPDNISAAFIEKQYPQFANIINRREAAQARKEEMKLRFAEIASRKDESKEEKKDKFIQALRKETTSGALGKMFSNYNTATRMGSALEEFAKNPTAYSDYATLMGGLKALQGDESVVREAEVRLGMSATSLANKAKNWTDRLVTGKSLQPSQRDEMVKAVKVLSETARKQYADAVSPIMKQAEGIGINKDLLINEGFLSEKKSAPDSSNKVLVEKDGKQFRLPKEQLQRAISQGYKEVK